MADSHSNDYLSLFQTRHDQSRILLTLSKQQQQAIEHNQMDDLLSILGRKQKVITAMEVLSKQQPELWKNWKHERDQFSEHIQRHCDRLLQETENFLAQLIQQEQQDTDALTKRRDETKTQLEQISQSVQTNQAYRDNLAPATHRHLDIGG